MSEEQDYKVMMNEIKKELKRAKKYHREMIKDCHSLINSSNDIYIINYFGPSGIIKSIEEQYDKYRCSLKRIRDLLISYKAEQNSNDHAKSVVEYLKSATDIIIIKDLNGKNYEIKMKKEK